MSSHPAAPYHLLNLQRYRGGERQMAKAEVAGLFIGKAVDEGRGYLSALDKLPAAAEVWLGPLGLEGDEQGDSRHHGGPERAVHLYPAEHYAYWRERYPQVAWQRPAFGENLASRGLLESQVCIGDLFRWGDALLQVSQPRSPCYRLAERWALPGLALEMQDNGLCGWFFRVLRPGWVGAALPLELVQRSHPGLSVAQAIRSYFQFPLERGGLQQLLACQALSERWRHSVARRLASGQLEDWRNRLEGPARPVLSA